MSMERIFGVDVGGTGIKMGAIVASDPPRVLDTDLLLQEVDRPVGKTVAMVASRLKDLARSVGWDRADGIGIGSAGLIESAKGRIAFSPNLPAWAGAVLSDLFSRELDLPVRVDNDVNAFALAEWRWGAGERARDVVFLTIGTGVGGAFVSDGRLIRGANGFAGEPGHMTLVMDGIPCPCGNRGCAERYVGSQGITDAARQHPDFGQDPLSELDPITPEDLSRAAREGSRVAREVLAETGEKLGAILVSLVNVFNPDRVILGGGISQAGGLLLDPAREHLSKRSLVARHAPPKVLPAALGEHAGVLGAAAVILDAEGLARDA
jgi:glucokinase